MFIDDNGNSWDTAQEALDDFLSDLPCLSDKGTELVFQFTDRSARAETNLKAIAYGVMYAGLDHKFEGDNYPVPYPATDCSFCGGYVDSTGETVENDPNCGSSHESDCEACGNSICDLSC